MRRWLAKVLFHVAGTARITPEGWGLTWKLLALSQNLDWDHWDHWACEWDQGAERCGECGGWK